MSALDGLAQFGLSMTNSYMANKEKMDKKKAAEEEKQYQRGREKVTDLRAQERFDIEKASAQIKLKNEQQGAADVDDERGYKQAYNRYEYSRSVGDTNGAINAIISGTNSNSKIPFKVDVERDETGKPVERKDDEGNVYYHQNVYDKDTGELMMSSTTTADGLLESFNKLENASEIAAANAAYEAAKRKKQEENQSELSLYTAKAVVDEQVDNNKAKRDYIYKVDEMGVKHGYTIDELGVKHGYTIDELGVRHANAVDLSNVNAQNNIGIRTAQSDIDAGGTPIVGGAAWGSFDALIGPESNGQQLDANGRPLTSSAGAIGIAQVMPDTGKYVAEKNGIKWDEKRYKTDPNYNYQLGKLYYQEQLNKYGHPALAYAAYNAGPGAVDKWIKKNPAMKNPDAMGMQNFINAIPFSETKNYVAKIHRQSGGVQVQRSVPGVPKAAKGSKTTQAQSGEGITNTRSYNANIDKGVNTALKGVKNLGIKSDAATTATFARAGTKLKEMGKARSEQEFLGLYQEAFDLVLDAVPERSRSKMSKADQNALGHKVLLSMVGASSLGNLKDIVYRINPSARGGGSVTAGGLTLPGQQARAPAPTKQTPQTGKLKALYSRGLPAPQTDPNAAETFNYLENLNDNMDW